MKKIINKSANLLYLIDLDGTIAGDNNWVSIRHNNKSVYNHLHFNPDNYNIILESILNVYDEILLTHSTFEAHIILEGFTISAAERYKTVIQLFSNKCMNSSTKYSQLTTGMYVYYTPSMIENISAFLRPFIDTNVYERIIMYSKTESVERIQTLFC
jgi:hypothetical protein